MRDGTLGPGLFAGMLFGIEFVLIYQGLRFTSASRAAVFLYTAPFFVALGSYQLLGERLRASQWAGLALSFAGVALAIGVPQANVDAKRPARRSHDGRRRRAVGRDHADRQGHAAALRRAGEGAGLSGRDLDPDPRRRRLAVRRKDHPMSRGRCALGDGLSGDLGGGSDLHAVVRAGADLFRQQIVGLHLHHAAVRRGGELFHPARYADASPSASRRCWSSRGFIW